MNGVGDCFLVNLTKRKGKYIWEAEPIDFPEQENKYRMSMMGLEDDIDMI